MIRAVGTSPLEAALELAPRAAELAPEAERERRVGAAFSSELAAAGLYRACVPASLGGGEAPPRELLGAIEALATGDGAAGWCVAVCATAGMLAAYLEPERAAEVYGNPDAVAGGVFAPSGRASADGDKLTVSGRPDVRLVLMPAAAVEVIDTWSVSGLRATGSHDIAVDGLELPAARSASLITDSPREPGPLYAFPPFGLLAAAIAAVALGIARGALDDLGALAGAKTPTLSTRKLAERAATQSGLARAEATLGGSRALLLETVDRAWDAARGGGAIPIDLRARLRLAATHAVESSAGAVDRAWSLAGGSAIYETGPLERRFRDVHAATQHMLVAPPTWELTGRSLLGLELDASQL